ncbi:MAG: hypothetical protein L0Z50_15675, partial [Verrucomicrobiales bacterium]|nr:hypothetical protein [Verrucomicrobiales bacterium]
MRTHGIEVKLGRVRLRGFHELSARDLQFGQTGHTNGVRLTIPDAGLQLDIPSLKRLQFKIESLVLRKAELVWPVGMANGFTESLIISDISTTLRFANSEKWELEHCDGDLLGARLHLSASITNAAALRSWLAPAKPGQTSAWPAAINRWAARLKQVQLPPTSVLTLSVNGDGRDPASFRADLKLQT